MSGRGVRKPILCPSCRVPLAYLRPEWLILERLLPTRAAIKTERIVGAIVLTCQCGAVHTVEWHGIQF